LIGKTGNGMERDGKDGNCIGSFGSLGKDIVGRLHFGSAIIIPYSITVLAEGFEDI
jgi:hypothetical protein